MILIRYNILFVCCLTSFWPLHMFAQNYKKDIQGVYWNLRAVGSYSMDMEYYLYLDGDLSRPYQTRKVQVKRDVGKIYMKENTGLEVIDNGEVQVFIDHKNKKMSVIKKEKETTDAEELKLVNDFFDTYLDTMMTVFDKIKFIDTKQNIVNYECLYKANDFIQKSFVSINRTNNMLDKTISLYVEPRMIPTIDNKPHYITVEVRYRNYKAKPNIPKTLFDLDSYIQVNNNKQFTPNSKYKNYQFISALN